MMVDEKMSEIEPLTDAEQITQDSSQRYLSDGAPESLQHNKTLRERFCKLQENANNYLTDDDKKQLEKAFHFAMDAHRGQFRKSGEPFIAHPLEVAIILSEMHMDVDTLCAALLHDTVEDTNITLEVVEEEFNKVVANLVAGVTKITMIEVDNLSDEQAATIRKMLVAMNKDIRVIVIKLADRLHNMRTLDALREDRRIFKSRETLEIYAPIAHRLGINSIKWELEDLSFFFLEPRKYRQLSRMVDESRAKREQYVADVIKILKDEMHAVGINAEINGRPKHLYSIYQKMTKRGKGFSEIYDLIAIRIVVDTVIDCYSVLGAVHALWHPMPGRFKDYIAMPKPNMYQSLHTTVIGPAARPLEVQIRTVDMHHDSEFGVAAHWRYKERGKRTDERFDQQLAWVREMVDWQDESIDSKEFLRELKVDLAPSEVFVFTPRGDVISLPTGSNPVDFAYAIHTEVGNHCVGAKVNGSIVALNYALQQGDRIEIMTQKGASPSRDWLGMVKTTSARSKIRSYFSKMSRSDDLQNGKDKLNKEMRKNGFGISNARSVKVMGVVAEGLGYKDSDEMLVSIGTGRENTMHVVNRMLKLLFSNDALVEKSRIAHSNGTSIGKMPPMLTSVKHQKTHEAHTSNGVVVRGVDNAAVKLARCCNPVPGDEIMGFVTRGRGVSVHRGDCPNVEDLMKTPERLIDVYWEEGGCRDAAYTMEIVVTAPDRTNLLRDVVLVISEVCSNIMHCELTVHKDGISDVSALIMVSDLNIIEPLLAKLRRLDGVFEARRVIPQKTERKE